MFGALTEQLGACFLELMEELRAIREELAGVKAALEDKNQHAALRPVKKPAAGRGK